MTEAIKSFEKMTVTVTGGASGIGRAVVLLCAQRGARVAIWDIDQSAAEGVADEARSRGTGGAIGLRCDVGIEQDVRSACAAAEAALGPSNALFAGAGIDAGGFIHQMPAEVWQRIIRTNLDGVFLSCKQVIGRMIAANIPGSVVCCSSPAAFVSLASGGAGAYSASKGAISSLVCCMAIDYAPAGIRVNAIAPGPTETRLMWANVGEAQRAAMREQIAREVPLGRLADPLEVARAVVWLLSDESSYVTGSHLVCDGGMLAKASVSV